MTSKKLKKLNLEELNTIEMVMFNGGLGPAVLVAYFAILASVVSSSFRKRDEK